MQVDILEGGFLEVDVVEHSLLQIHVAKLSIPHLPIFEVGGFHNTSPFVRREPKIPPHSGTHALRKKTGKRSEKKSQKRRLGFRGGRGCLEPEWISRVRRRKSRCRAGFPSYGERDWRGWLSRGHGRYAITNRNRTEAAGFRAL